MNKNTLVFEIASSDEKSIRESRISCFQDKKKFGAWFNKLLEYSKTRDCVNLSVTDWVYTIVIRSISIVSNHFAVISITFFFSRSDLILGILQNFWHLSAVLCAVYRQFLWSIWWNSRDVKCIAWIPCVVFYNFLLPQGEARRTLEQSKREVQTCVRLSRFLSH